MAIIQALGIPSKVEPGLGAHIGRKFAEKLLVDLPEAALKTAAGIPFSGGVADTEEDEMLRQAIKAILSRQRSAASGAPVFSPQTANPAPALNLMPLTGLGAPRPV